MPSINATTAAQAWLRQDPDPETRAELQRLLDAASEELEERFNGPLRFGTAGLRGLIGAGETRMNRAVVRRTSAGLAHYLRSQVPGASERGVVIGYDGRRQSDVFAQEVAQTLCAAGIACYLARDVCPTPLVSFAVTRLGAAAGVMVTASHNPPAYNGYKIFAANGAQIIAPADREIAAAIAQTGPANSIEVAALDKARASGLLQDLSDDLAEEYLEALATLDRGKGDRSLGIAYTPLHGVGLPLLRRAFAAAGYQNLYVVAEQAEPDGAFPTVDFPNPEEPGALDLALSLAREHDAHLLLANDPDADRLAAAVRTSPGRYRQLTGNEVGVLLGHHLLERDSSERDDRLVIATAVSSPQLGVIARQMGASYEETLTGFKWIANRAMDLERQGKRFVFGYEEALGYTVGTVVRDKDGIGAALVLASLAATLHQRGETLLDELDRLSQRFGHFESTQRSLRFSGADGGQKMAQLMAALREEPPTEIAQSKVARVGDCQQGNWTSADGQVTPLRLPSSDVLIYQLEGGHRVIVRPSGTEPKLKLYVDVQEHGADGEALASVKDRAAKRIEQLATEMVARLAP